MRVPKLLCRIAAVSAIAAFTFAVLVAAPNATQADIAQSPIEESDVDWG